MTREEAIDVMREKLPWLTEDTKRLVMTLVPELADSDDEKARKFLIQHISEWIGCIEHDLKISSKDIESEKELAMFKAGLAYLEKQKESLYIPETCKENADSFTDACKDVIVAIEKYLDWLTGYPDYAPKGKYSLRDMLHCLSLLEKQMAENVSATTMIPSCWAEKQKEHQSCPDAPKEKKLGSNFYPSDKDKNLDEIAQDYVDGVKEYNSEPTWDLIQTAVCYGYHLSEEQFEKNRLANCDSLSKEECDRETDFAMEIIEKEHRHPTFNDAINYGMRLQKEQKPAEYLDNDKVYAIMNKLHNLSFSQRIPINSDEYKQINEITNDVRSLLNYPIEQKSAEKQDYSGLNDLERAIHRGFLAAGMENVPVGIIKDTASECMGFLALIDPEPVKWSEEDEKMLKWLCRIIHSRVVNKELSLAEESELGKWIDKWINHEPQQEKKWSEFDEDCLKRAIWYVENPAPKVVRDTNLVLWLQSLPERFNLQPKEEWSDEDEQDFDDLIMRFGKSLKMNRCYFTSYDVDWLKSKFNGNSCK